MSDWPACTCCGHRECPYASMRAQQDAVRLAELGRYLFDRTSDASWLDARPELLEAYLPVEWQGATLEELAQALTEQGTTSAHCAPFLGDRYRAVATGHAGYEPGYIYTVVAVYDGLMDLVCSPLDIMIAQVCVGDPALERVRDEPNPS